MLRKLLGGLAVMALVSTSTVAAHEQFRIIGKIVKFENWRLDVETADGETFVFPLHEHSVIWRDKTRVTAKELRVGRSVFVDVSADSLYDADRFIVGVTLIPSLAPKGGKQPVAQPSRR
jgi:hypothetical protein